MKPEKVKQLMDEGDDTIKAVGQFALDHLERTEQYRITAESKLAEIAVRCREAEAAKASAEEQLQNQRSLAQLQRETIADLNEKIALLEAKVERLTPEKEDPTVEE